MRTNGAAIFVLVAQNRALISSSHHQLQSLSSAKRNQNSEKSARHACALFFDAAEPVGDKHAALSVDHGWRKVHARRRHKTNTVHSLFRVLLLTILLKYTDKKIAEFIVNSSRRRHVTRKEWSHRWFSVDVTERTSSFRVLSKVDFDVLVRRWTFFHDAREACECSFLLPWTLVWHWRDRPHSAVAVWRTWRQSTVVENEKHASPSSRTPCFIYFTLACNRLASGRKDQQKEESDIEGVAALLRRSGAGMSTVKA